MSVNVATSGTSADVTTDAREGGHASATLQVLPPARLAAEAVDVERRTKLERLRCPDRVDAADEAADPLERLRVVEVRRTAAASRIKREPEARMHPRMYGGDHRDLVSGELARKGVLLLDLRVAPAAGAVELGDQRFGAVDADLVDAVFVAVQREYTQVGEAAGALDGVDHQFRRQRGEGVQLGHDSGLLVSGRSLYHRRQAGALRSAVTPGPGRLRSPRRRASC